MAVVIGEFDVIEQPHEAAPLAPAAAPPTPPLRAIDLDRLAAQQLQRELRCLAD